MTAHEIEVREATTHDVEALSLVGRQAFLTAYEGTANVDAIAQHVERHFSEDSIVRELGIAVADPALGSWQELDADTYAVPIEANGLFFRAGTTEVADLKAGFSHGDSSDDWSGDIEAKTDVGIVTRMQ